jgi:hypothetical protein
MRKHGSWRHGARRSADRHDHEDHAFPRLARAATRHIVRQSRFDADDEVAMPPDRPAGQTDLGVAEVVQLAAGRNAGTGNIYQGRSRAMPIGTLCV